MKKKILIIGGVLLLALGSYKIANACYAETECSNGESVSCHGSIICDSGPGYVDCDNGTSRSECDDYHPEEKVRRDYPF